MTAAMAMVLVGGLLIYMGVKGYSVSDALLGGKLSPTKAPPSTFSRGEGASSPAPSSRPAPAPAPRTGGINPVPQGPH